MGKSSWHNFLNVRFKTDQHSVALQNAQIEKNILSSLTFNQNCQKRDKILIFFKKKFKVPTWVAARHLVELNNLFNVVICNNEMLLGRDYYFWFGNLACTRKKQSKLDKLSHFYNKKLEAFLILKIELKKFFS